MGVSKNPNKIKRIGYKRDYGFECDCNGSFERLNVSSELTVFLNFQ